MIHSVKAKSKLMVLLSLLLVASLFLAACETDDNTGVGEEPVVEEVVEEEPVEEAVVEEEPVVAEEAAEEIADDDGEAEVVEEGEGVAPIQDVVVTAGTLLSFGVDNVNDEDLGAMDDLIIDTTTGQINYAVMESTGFLGFGGEDLLVPFNAFELAENGNELLLPFVAPEDIEGAPTFDDDAWDSMDPAWDDEFFGFWSGSDFGVDLMDMDGTTRHVLATSLVGFPLGAIGNFSTGVVLDVLVDMGSGHAKWMVLDYESAGIADIDYVDNVVLVPFSAFDWQMIDETLIFTPSFDEAILASAPLVARADLTPGSFFDPAFDDDLDTYWQDAGFDMGAHMHGDSEAVSTEATEEGAMQPAITVDDQEAGQNMVIINNVTTAAPGWVVIHADNDGAPGDVIGYAAVNGMQENVEVEIDSAAATPVLYAMLHDDLGTEGTYEFPGDDLPTTVDGNVVITPFNATDLE